MPNKKLIARVKEYRKLLNEYFTIVDKHSNLTIKRTTISEEIFPDRLQPTKGFFIAKPTNFIVPNDWGKSDPCAVTIYRHGVYDPIEDGIINCGDKNDVKTFYCPYFNENAPCTAQCKYRAQNNEYFTLEPKINAAAEKREQISTQRHAAWKQIFHSK